MLPVLPERLPWAIIIQRPRDELDDPVPIHEAGVGSPTGVIRFDELDADVALVVEDVLACHIVAVLFAVTDLQRRASRGVHRVVRA